MTILLHYIFKMMKSWSTANVGGLKRTSLENRIRLAKERALESTPETIQFMN